MTIDQEVIAYRAGTMDFLQLSEGAQAQLVEEFQIERCGFKPDFMIRASGVTMDGRQAVLNKARKYIGATRTIPVRLEFEPENKFDPDAIAVLIPTLQDGFGDWVAWEKAGYIPKGRCPGCGRTLTGPMLEKRDDCPDCNFKLFRDVLGEDPQHGHAMRIGREPTQESVEFNKYVGRLIREGKVKWALDNIVADPTLPKGSIGLNIAFKLKDQNAAYKRTI